MEDHEHAAAELLGDDEPVAASMSLREWGIVLAAGIVVAVLLPVVGQMARSRKSGAAAGGAPGPLDQLDEPFGGAGWETSLKHLALGWDQRYAMLDGRLERIEAKLAGAGTLDRVFGDELRAEAAGGSPEQ